MRDAALKVKGGGNGFHLKRHRLKAGSQRGALQRGLGQGVALGVVVDKVHGTPEHGTVHGLAQVGFGAGFQFFEKQHHDVKKAHELAVDHGLLFHQAAAQQAFDGAHQPPANHLVLCGFQVGLQGGTAVVNVAVFG